MHWIDWTVVAIFLFSMILVGVLFSKKAGKSIDSFFVSGRTLTWYVAGASMIATSFASDTPLWVSALVRQYGIQAVWQYWAPLIGSALGVVLFARLWRRSAVVTDNELIELRYSGKSAGFMRGFSAGVGALVICPLIIGWVSKAMVTIASQALGLGADAAPILILGLDIPPDMVATLVVMTCALLLCAFSGLYGVVYTDFIQFIIATAGAFLLAFLSIKYVGGIEAMVNKLSSLQLPVKVEGSDETVLKDWAGQGLNLAPKISGSASVEGGAGAMSIWNVIGYFGILWWGVALSGAYNAQRILACKDTRHASNAVLVHTIVYYAVISIPWVVVGLASLIVFPDLGGESHDAAYPKMLLTILPVGARGLLIAAMIAAFISTMSTMFNWGSSYIVNDLYRRFMVRDAGDKHYVRVARIITLLVAVMGGVISFHTDNIQQLLSIFYVVGTGGAVVGILRWCWWRITAIGEIAALTVNWIFAFLLLFGHTAFGWDQPIFDAPMAKLLGLADGVSFTSSHDTLGARMLFIMVLNLNAVIAGSLLSKPTDPARLKEFVQRTRIFVPGWRAVTRNIPDYRPAHKVSEVLLDWGLVVATVCSLLFSLNNMVCDRFGHGAWLFAVFVVLLVIVLKRTKRECPVDDAKQGEGSENS